MTSLIWNPGHELLLTDIVRADNCTLYDSSGKKYVDLESGVWCTSIGHANRAVLRVVHEQLERISHTGFCYTTRSTEESAQTLLDLVGFDGGRCIFLSSGSEAVEFAVRLARTVVSRQRMIIMHDGYFGAYGSAHRRADDEWYSFDWTGCAPCERLAEVPFQEIGGFLFEPGSASGWVRFPPRDLIASIAERVRADDGLVLVNEVTTGIGRTGAWFGFEHYGLKPDIVAVGKGIGGGYPVSAVLVAPHVIERLGDTRVPYAQSHQNDPMGAVIAREVVRFIRQEGLIERARELGDVLQAGLERIRQRTGRISEVRARGLMAAVDIEDDADASYTGDVHRELVRRGFIVCKKPGVNLLRMDPPLTIERSDIDDFLETFEDVLAR